MLLPKKVIITFVLNTVLLCLLFVIDSNTLNTILVVNSCYALYLLYSELYKPLKTFHSLNHYYLKDQFEYYISDINLTSNDIISKLARSYNELSLHLTTYSEVKKSYHDLVNTKKMLLKELEVRKALELSTEVYLQQLERMYENVEEFSYMTSHDLKAPLKTLVSFIELLSEDVEGDDKESINEDLYHIKLTANRMDKIIGNILEISKSGISPLNLEFFNINEMISDVIDSVKIDIIEKNIIVEIMVNESVCYADRNLVERVVQNLVSNAIKFSENGGEIDIKCYDTDKFWNISVKDFGIGIKKDELNNIFKPFNKLNNDSQYEGSGVGLSICEKIIERHGGNINVFSEVGKGTEFTFTLSKELKTVYEKNQNSIG